jgi:hypothetical protein
MKVWRRNVGQAQRQWTQDLFPLRSVTGATPAYFWSAADNGLVLRMPKQELQREFGIGRIVLGSTRRGVPIAGERCRLHGKEHEEVML